ncbi:lytic murein transglycosylase [Sphingomonas sp. ASV193]|uniref:lytic murein transglycosylase n=1 Tax=Sphingomonas sp. ASV193 TaxID=3144405 RepID=UPI0032E89077
MRRRLVLASIAVALGVAGDRADAAHPAIQTTDVENFYRVYDGAAGHPSAVQLQRDYLDQGSGALHRFADDRKITGESLANAIAVHPLTFIGARRCAAILPAVRTRLAGALRRLGRLYPSAAFPPVTIVVGRGTTAGTTNATGVLIGLETLCAADYMDPDLAGRFVHSIAHEYVHVQQPAAQTQPDHPTVLFASLIEGGAEFVGSLISGDVGNWQLKRWTKGHEATIEHSFAADETSTNTDPWVWAGPGTREHPGDLGYWVGERIVRCYYDRARDKRRAIAAIITISSASAPAFLAASGWRPGKRCA